MFLTAAAVFTFIGNTINCILSWIESYSVSVGIIVSITVGSLWFHKYLKQKRAEAFFGFYAQLLFRLKSLRTWLNDKDLLEINDPQKGNIYALMYSKEKLQKVCAGFHVPSNEELEESKGLVAQLKEILTESDNNVYPKNSNRTRWYDSQQILLKFCEFFERDSMHGNTNMPKAHLQDNEYKHTVMCKKLIDAMDYIQASIENEKY